MLAPLPIGILVDCAGASSATTVTGFVADILEAAKWMGRVGLLAGARRRVSLDSWLDELQLIYASRSGANDEDRPVLDAAKLEQRVAYDHTRGESGGTACDSPGWEPNGSESCCGTPSKRRFVFVG